jgi:type II secretory pathway component PulK
MKRARQDGSALLLVVWAIIMLTAALLAWVSFMEADLERSADANRQIEARSMAHSGVAYGKNMMVSERTPGLERQFTDQMGFRVRIIGEGGKLDINWLLAGEEPRKLDLLSLWLEQHGLTFQERERFIDCLLDYTDADTVKRLNGQEDAEGYTPKNRPLESVEELAEVAGVEPLLKSPGWQEELTVYSQAGIDLTAAQENILRLLPGLGEARIVRLLQFRRGRDQIDGTMDDYQFKNLAEIWSVLGFSQAQQKELSGLVTAKSPIQRILSEGRSANVVRQVEVVVRKGGANPTILHWKE